MITLYLDDDLKTQSQIKNQFLYHRDGETYEEPKMTGIIPSKYIIGDMTIPSSQEQQIETSNVVFDSVEEPEVVVATGVPNLNLDDMFSK